ncbi:1-acyl-sn-glycerol-3-phosphate acyltransferase 2-like isoform X2 [Rhododendron vialii]|uniref:1-acyl-sn-glycerol-3-phosphate acyltransferase 2-like isoform X2 n=1 Tax=Rhododendron vialii TaxID=182163 RepID=UPI002660172D|nr:1-acyl-sn-glycerol-3-phosphate acyltransferase 2-like isoform X2 [Rhododendron vialii]
MGLLYPAILAFPFGCLYIFTGLIVNVIQATCFVFIWPLSRSLFRRINGVVVQMLWLEFLFCLQWWAGIKVQLYTDSKTYKLLGKEHALIIPNHRHDVDWLVVWTLAQYFGCLGSAPVISKDSSKFFPVLGWSTWFSDFVYLKRNWNKDEGVLKSSLQALKDFPRPFWLIFFVEGTRLTQKKLLAAQEYAASTGIHVPKNVLVPRTKGFVSTVKYIRSFVPAVYDVTLAVPKNVPPPSVKGMFSKQPSLVKVYIKRYPVEELPKSDEGIAEWCRDRFVAKVAIFWIGALLLSIYKLFQTCSPLSSWKGIGITTATLFIVEMLMYVLLLSTQQEQSTPEKQAASPKTSPNKE